VANELHFGERERFVERLNARRAARRPAGPEAAEAALLAIVSGEEERLEELLAEHLEREESCSGVLEFDASEAGERLRRYQASCDRTLLRVLEALRKRRRDAEGAGSGRRRAARPVTEEAPDPSGRISGLLNLLAAVKGASSTNEPNGPSGGGTFGVANLPASEPGPSDSGRTRGLIDEGQPAAPTPPPCGRTDDSERESPPDTPGEPDHEPGRAGSSAASQGDEPHDHDATNEPKEPARAADRPVSALPAVLLALIAMLLSAGLAASYAAPMVRAVPDRWGVSLGAGPGVIAKERSALANSRDQRRNPLVVTRREC
jgi:hypothetical protein